MTRLTQLIDDYLAGPQILRNAVSEMTQENLLARPVAGAWSTLEVVCHLSDFDAIYADRMKRIIAEDRPRIMGADQEAYAACLSYHDRDAAEEIDMIERTRNLMARILKRMPAGMLERNAIHCEPGSEETRSLERYLSLIIEHIPHHVKFIFEKRRALRLPA